MKKLTLTVNGRKDKHDETTIRADYILKRDRKIIRTYDIPYDYDEENEEIEFLDYCSVEEDRGRIEAVCTIFALNQYHVEQKIVKDVKENGKSSTVYELP